MKKNILIITVLFMGLAIGCKEDKKTDASAENIQMKRVMALHDEVMPKMSGMSSLASELSSKEDSTELGLKYKQARIDLQEANEAMMAWMQSFSSRFDSQEIMEGKELSATKKQWLDEEEEKMKKVKEVMVTSIKNAKHLLGKEE